MVYKVFEMNVNVYVHITLYGV